ncbi:simple sugar transport system permease protein [Psychromicrobium silvestre]|uniref:Simple sugar transport system permease protein n=1 Tax=Psychromicrobium silvestre TaxID=1645614 RepID=A0A7Y9S832_9MICC|nr:ABC transporter permease [Psychromicrobium silvestre]NYE96484.1 simple sugar transport system permease protein [Psychromicrobium silvestre]
MSTVTQTPKSASDGAHRNPVKVELVSWKAGVGLSLLALLGLVLFGFLANNKTAGFRITDVQDAGTAGVVAWVTLVVAVAAVAWLGFRWWAGRGKAQARWLPVTLVTAVVVAVLALLGVTKVEVISVPAAPFGWVVAILLCLLAAYAVWLTTQKRKLPGWLGGVFALLFVFGFLVWIVAGGRDDLPSISLLGLIAGAVTLAVPLVFGSLSGVLSERVGVVNIAIEGQLLLGAFSAAVVGTITGNVFIGLLAAAVAGALVSLVLAVVSIKYLVNQIIVGVVLNVLVSGLTSFLFSTVLTANPEQFNQPPRLDPITIPFLSEIPIIGPILFRQSLIGYLMYIAVIVVYLGLYYTKWGLRVRAVGEHPQAADTVGINVNRTRFWNVLLGGAVAGIGGSFFALVSADAFSKDMSAGKGYIALAALIFGRWNPIGAFLAALLFGFADNLQSIITIIGSPVPGQFMAMLPYVLTIIAVAGLVGRSRPPAASGEPYVKG